LLKETTEAFVGFAHTNDQLRVRHANYCTCRAKSCDSFTVVTCIAYKLDKLYTMCHKQTHNVVYILLFTNAAHIILHWTLYQNSFNYNIRCTHEQTREH